MPLQVLLTPATHCDEEKMVYTQLRESTITSCLLHIDVNSFNILVGRSQPVCLHILDIVHHFQPREDTTEDGVFLVKPWCRCCGNEELRTVGPRTGVGHTECVRSIWRINVNEAFTIPEGR